MEQIVHRNDTIRRKIIPSVYRREEIVIFDYFITFSAGLMLLATKKPPAGQPNKRSVLIRGAHVGDR